MFDKASTLTREEVRDITGGCQQRATQIRELTAMGIPFVCWSDGWPAVDRSAYYEAMRGKKPERRQPGMVMNLEAL